MSTEVLPKHDSPQEIIRLLQQELAETNREVMMLTLELEKRVEERTAALQSTQEELELKNSELLDLALELEGRVARRTQELAQANEALRQEITERRQAEQQVRQLNDELEKRVRERTAQLEAINQELEAFSYSVSHDLRAPLRHICGYANALAKDHGSSLDEQGKECVENINRAAGRMAALIAALLSFARMGQKPVKTDDVKLAELVALIISEMRPEQGTRHVEWIVSALPTVRGDAAMLRQVWVNLIANALKYTRGIEQARIEIGWREEASEWIFFVRDNGAGFDMKHADRLFGIFQRLHSQQEFEGSGVGLANVRRIISRHSGRTWAEGEPGKGATFYFSLPRPLPTL